MSSKLRTLLSIAGSDPTGGAGIQADIRAGISLGLHVMTAVTAVTSQNSKGFYQIGAVPQDLLRSQLNSITKEVKPDAIKIGMIGSIQNIITLSDVLKSLPSDIPVVIDPVMKASADGNALLNDNDVSSVIGLYKSLLFPYATVVTPNMDEMSLLIDNQQWNKEEPTAILNILHTRGVILKGGHSREFEIEDMLITSDAFFINRHYHLDCKNLHGTGCVYSSILASYLALGYKIEEAFQLTSSKLYKIISLSQNYILGDSNYGPLNINKYYL